MIGDLFIVVRFSRRFVQRKALRSLLLLLSCSLFAAAGVLLLSLSVIRTIEVRVLIVNRKGVLNVRKNYILTNLSAAVISSSESQSSADI